MAGAPAPGTGAGGLILVATPIGNVEDMTMRALRTLKEADAVACEDTRHTGALLARFGIKRKLLSYHEHNAQRMRPEILDRLRRGQSVALVSDAGTPLVSDPGFKLVREAIEAGMPVTAVPGPSAVLAGLLVSGLAPDRFLFAGFLPAKTAARRQALGEVALVPATLVFFESPNRIAESLADMADVLGDRPAAVGRELTKLYEEVRRATLLELARGYAGLPAPKGEIVVIVGAPAEQAPAQAEAIDEALKRALETMSLRDAAAAVAAATGRKRREVYARALEIGRTGKVAP